MSGPLPYYRVLESKLAPLLSAHGFDLLSSFQVQWYNAKVAPQYKVLDYGRGNTLGIMVGNTRALWEPFLLYCRDQPELLNVEHPLDTYAERSISAAVDSCSIALPHALLMVGRWPPEVLGQTAAHVSGLAYLSHKTRHCLHPKFGPWVALRAVLVVDCDGPEAPPPPFPFEITDEATCGDPSVTELFQRLSRATEQASGEADCGLSSTWRGWVELRDTFKVGREYRYTDQQIEYHYTKSKELLRSCVDSLGGRADTAACADTA
eukprot:RCo008626